jgi:hypothetical protein
MFRYIIIEKIALSNRRLDSTTKKDKSRHLLCGLAKLENCKILTLVELFEKNCMKKLVAKVGRRGC